MVYFAGGDTIKALRVALNKTQEEFGKMLNQEKPIDQNTISDYEHNRYPPSVDVARRIINVASVINFPITLDELYRSD